MGKAYHNHEQNEVAWHEQVRHGRRGPGGRFGFGPGRRGSDGPFGFGPGRRGPGGPPAGFGPFGPGGPGDLFGDDHFDRSGPRRRQRRGEIKFALLELLAEQPRHGYELIKALETRYGGFYRPSPGSVYPTLQLLEDEGYLSSATDDGKRIYTITPSGRELLAARQAQGGSDRLHPEQERADLDGLRRSTGALLEGVMQVARYGSPEQARTVAELLDQTRRAIYTLLAQ